MSGYLSIAFIEAKIKELENALFFSMSDAVLKIPTCVVKVLQTDELGQIWFVIPKPPQFIHAFDKTFPVKLDFFRKGKEYYIKVFGKAYLVNDPEEINSVECLNEHTKQRARNSEAVIVKVKINRAEYVETSPAKVSAKAILHQVKNKLDEWLQQSQREEAVDYQKIPVQVKYPSLISF